MSESSGFFVSQGGDRRYTPAWLARFIKALVTTGVYKDELAVTAGDGMAVSLPYGRAWVEGYLYLNDAPISMAIGNADSVLGRRDSVVVRLNLTDRTVTAMVLPGAFSASPAAPAPTRNADIYDLKLAEISVPAGTTKITQDLIMDTRLDDTVCGITVCTVQYIPTATFLAQMQAEFAVFMQKNTDTFAPFMQESEEIFASFMRESGAEFDALVKHDADSFAAFLQESGETFDAWFKDVMGVLGEDEAGRLYGMIRSLSYTREFEAEDWTEGDGECTITIPADDHVMTGDTVSCRAFMKDAKTSEYRQDTWGAMMTYATLSENGDIVVHYPDLPGYAGKVVLSTSRNGIPITPPTNFRSGQSITDQITGKLYDLIVENEKLAIQRMD